MKLKKTYINVKVKMYFSLKKDKNMSFYKGQHNIDSKIQTQALKWKWEKTSKNVEPSFCFKIPILMLMIEWIRIWHDFGGGGMHLVCQPSGRCYTEIWFVTPTEHLFVLFFVIVSVCIIFFKELCVLFFWVICFFL